MLIDAQRLGSDGSQRTAMNIRIAIVEDDEDVMNALSYLFRQSPGFEFVAGCPSAEDALQRLPGLHLDAILLDVHLPGASGIESLPELKLRCPQVQICILTVFEDAELVFRALKRGATGYLLKKTPPTQLLEAVRELHAGGSPMSSQIARKLVDTFAERDFNHNKSGDPKPELETELCARERQILDLLAKGHRYKEIADDLGISIHTVRTFIRRMYEKLHVHSRTEALNRIRGT
jgi:DNA-binding NarL/FixJ family response regulator